MVEPVSLGRCSRRLVAAGDCSLVEQCSCGAIHLTIGAVTLRLARSAIASLAITLEAAAREFVVADERVAIDDPLVS